MIANYIKNIGLEHLNWRPNTIIAPQDAVCLGIVDHLGEGHLSLEVVTPGALCDNQNTWLSTDDGGWSGPVRFVVAWVPVGVKLRG